VLYIDGGGGRFKVDIDGGGGKLNDDIEGGGGKLNDDIDGGGGKIVDWPIEVWLRVPIKSGGGGGSGKKFPELIRGGGGDVIVGLIKFIKGGGGNSVLFNCASEFTEVAVSYTREFLVGKTSTLCVCL
jgi:hypothetical protein